MENNKLAELLSQKGFFTDNPIVLIDAGCSNSDGNDQIPSKFIRSFGSDLKTLGIDPVESECSRLTSVFKSRPGTHNFKAAYLTGPEEFTKEKERECRENYNSSPFGRSWAMVSQDKLYKEPDDWTKSRSTDGALSTEYLTLDDCLQDYKTVDFIKIDIDQPDCGALVGAEKTIKEKGVLGLELETGWHGYGRTSNSLTGITPRLEDLGLSLSMINNILPYSKNAFPSIPAREGLSNNHTGVPNQADVLFTRDPCQYAQDACPATPLDPIKKLKLCCILEIYDLIDCAAEILITFKDELDPVLAPFATSAKKLLDHIARNYADPPASSYQEHIARYDRLLEAIKNPPAQPRSGDEWKEAFRKEFL